MGREEEGNSPMGRRLRAVSAHLLPPASTTTTTGGVDLAANPTAGEYAHGMSYLQSRVVMPAIRISLGLDSQLVEQTSTFAFR